MRAVVELIAQEGTVTFARFMEVALYHPQWGYYTRARSGPGPAGPRGDFLTAPTASPLLAEVLGAALASLAEKRGEKLTFVELAAGEGVFLGKLVAATPPGAVARWVAVEVAEWARERVQALFPQVTVSESLFSVPRGGGPVVLFASELYDALPVHLVRGGERGELEELYVAATPQGELEFVVGRPSSPALASYLRHHGVVLAPGQLAEVRLQAGPFHGQVLKWAGEDALSWVVDYGASAALLYNSRLRRRGSLVGYWQHQRVDHVLAKPGEMDLTAHVNWDDLLQAGWAVGFEHFPPQPLGLFLTQLGAVPRLLGRRRAGECSWGDWELLAPGGLASDLKVLVQGKGRLWGAWQELLGASWGGEP